ncbi:MAG: hypothetical protein JEY79_14205 [Pseudodesulfovibrio sp.]|nr:hypothetical protein [Pseudodesulfovibrio sp.]
MKFKTKKMLFIAGIVALITTIAFGIATARSNQSFFSLNTPASFPVDI